MKELVFGFAYWLGSLVGDSDGAAAVATQVQRFADGRVAPIVLALDPDLAHGLGFRVMDAHGNAHNVALPMIADEVFDLAYFEDGTYVGETKLRRIRDRWGW